MSATMRIGNLDRPEGRTEPIAVVAIFGPTAVGKSRIAAEVAAACNGEIVSADSMQVYSGMPVLTDQPPARLLASVPHHLIGTMPLNEEFSAAHFARAAAAAIEEISGRGNLPVLVGGTGLYLRALLGNFSFAGRGDPQTRQQWERYIAAHGNRAGLKELSRLDPRSADFIDAGNPRRLARALEAAGSGRPVSAERQRLWSGNSPYQVLSFGLILPRGELYRRIDTRVDKMLANGAADEVRAALGDKVSSTAAQAIGFAEIAALIAGDKGCDEAAAAIKQKSRRYAKRQLTWMRKMPDIVRIDMAGLADAQAARDIACRIQQAGLIS